MSEMFIMCVLWSNSKSAVLSEREKFYTISVLVGRVVVVLVVLRLLEVSTNQMVMINEVY